MDKFNQRDLSATKTRLRCKLFRVFTLVLGINVPNQGTFIGSRWMIFVSFSELKFKLILLSKKLKKLILHTNSNKETHLDRVQRVERSQ
ncbi:MAG: hypothetical protein E7C03_07385 [Anaerococcus sp.]|nr:hypothetical protein [Anaerococcus sp.]